MDRTANLIHIAFIVSEKGRKQRLYLRKIHDRRYIWFVEEEPSQEKEGPVWSDTIERAMFLGNSYYRKQNFQTLKCGFRYTLPERDEHGTNALFFQMVASYNSPNGIYYDEEIGCNCIVQNASNEARALWKELLAKNPPLDVPSKENKAVKSV